MAFRPLHTASELHQAGAGTEFDPTAEIGEEIRGLRRAQGLTLKQLAAEAGISVGYLSEIERNLSRVPIGVLKSICDALWFWILSFSRRIWHSANFIFVPIACPKLSLSLRP